MEQLLLTTHSLSAISSVSFVRWLLRPPFSSNMPMTWGVCSQDWDSSEVFKEMKSNFKNYHETKLKGIWSNFSSHWVLDYEWSGTKLSSVISPLWDFVLLLASLSLLPLSLCPFLPPSLPFSFKLVTTYLNHWDKKRYAFKKNLRWQR